MSVIAELLDELFVEIEEINAFFIRHIFRAKISLCNQLRIKECFIISMFLKGYDRGVFRRFKDFTASTCMTKELIADRFSGLSDSIDINMVTP